MDNNTKNINKYKQILDIITIGALYKYEFNVTTGIVNMDIISEAGEHLNAVMGLKPPFLYNDMIMKMEIMGFVAYRNDIPLHVSANLLLDEYDGGNRLYEIHLYNDFRQMYIKMTYILVADENNEVYAYVIARDETAIKLHEENILKEGEQIRKQKDAEIKAVMDKAAQEQKTHTDITAALSDIYFVSYLADVVNNTFIKVKEPMFVKDMISKCNSIDSAFDIVLDRWIAKEDIEMMESFLDFRTLDSRLKEKNRVMVEFKGTIIGLEWCRASWIVAKKDERGKILQAMFVIEEISDLIKRRNEQEAKLKAAHEEAMAAKSAFLARMSHDIRTPLNGIIGIIEINERHSDDLEFIEANRKKAKIAANHLLSLINDILEISKLGDSNVKLAHEAFNLEALANDVLTIIELKAAEEGVTVNAIENDQNIPPYVFGSPLHVRQILINIFSNAIKYNKVGGSITCEARAEGMKGNKMIYSFTIADTGIGMSQGFMKKMFEPFSQEHTDARSTYQGTGLGMTIVKSLVERMDGEIQVSSTLGEGTTFVIKIPFEIATEKDLPKSANTREISLRGVRVLLVEDNELNTEIAKAILEDEGLVITEAHNGAEAVEIYSNNSPGTFDIILMDLMMPVMDGYEATSKIRNSGRSDAKGIQIVAMTSNTFAEDVQRCMECGMNGHIAKPIKIDELLGSLAKVLK